MYKELFGEIVKAAAVTILIKKSLQLMGKKDMGDIIGLGGLSVIGVDVVKITNQMLKDWDNLGIVKFFKALSAFGDKIEKLDDPLERIINLLNK